ncbi:MAG: DNA-protecting protein DprA, partial [Lachnospiraceae bacterium]|nr:DNA-protecting protein DprA [Lachnospiraceae bacterium]
AQMGIELISGMAVGIDGIAQRAALEAGGKVTAVLGSGVDVCYPKENRELYETLQQKGRIISEYIPGTEPVAGNFPLRNRIISGLADAVIVVEAKERSGTMITVDMALEQGREVYIIPGRLTDPLSAGCNRLISQGAEIIWNLGETLDMIRSTTLCKQYEIGGDQTDPYKTVGNKNDDSELCKPIEAPQNAKLCKQHESDILKTDASLYVVPPGLSYRQKTIWEALDFEPRTCQEIYERLMERSDIPFSTMQQELLEMELYGLIGQEGGRFFRKGD